MHILVVDDDPLAAEMSAAILEDAGYSVAMVQNGLEAVDRFNSNSTIDLVVSDMNMPLISGIDLFRSLREQGIRVPFILLTGDDPGPMLSEEPALDACLIKDFTLETSLVNAIATVLVRCAENQ
jgi:CheY-like chemotaxis protein